MASDMLVEILGVCVSTMFIVTVMAAPVAALVD